MKRFLQALWDWMTKGNLDNREFIEQIEEERKSQDIFKPDVAFNNSNSQDWSKEDIYRRD